MIRVKDEAGQIVPGLYRDDSGALVVKDDPGLNKYNKQKSVVSAQKATIEKLTNDVEELKKLVGMLIKEKE